MQQHNKCGYKQSLASIRRDVKRLRINTIMQLFVRKKTYVCI